MFNLKKLLLKEEQGLEGPPEQRELERLQLATCIILLEVAKSDDEFSSIEKETVGAIIKKRFNLTEEAQNGLLEMAGRVREESVDLWEFTNLVNENYSAEEKRKVVEEAWKVIYADDKLDRYEDHFIHRLAKLLRLEHRDLIQAKLKAKYG